MKHCHANFPSLTTYPDLVSTAYVLNCSQRDIDQAQPVSREKSGPAAALEADQGYT